MKSQIFPTHFILAVSLAALVAACGGPAEGTDTPPGEDTDLGDDTPPKDVNLWENEVDEPPEPGTGAADAVLGTRTVAKAADDWNTQVWKVTRNWADKVNKSFPPYFNVGDLDAAGKPLTWNEAYRVFWDKMEATQGNSGQKTFKITNPWGKTLPMPALECSEQAMFARISFAAWFGLPFFLEAIDSAKVRVFGGHFGFVTQTGRYKTFPNYKLAYKDFSATATVANWGKDTALRAKNLGYDDDQSGILPSGGKNFGEYLDELHANKRVGHFIFLVMDWFGSMNLADSANTFNLKPEGIRPGDFLIERWQRAGIGHVLNLKEVQKLPSGKLAAELASGSMPRRQPLWESAVASRRYFMLEYTGGQGNADDGTPYAKLGGGVKRWRVATVSNGNWVNTVPGDSTTNWINSTNLTEIAKRPAHFGEILDIPDPAIRRADLVASLDTARKNQRKFPASCSTREKREALLADLKELEMDEHDWSDWDFDTAYRTYDDYVFPVLKYEKSKTCCWNKTTEQMGAIIIDYNKEIQNQTNQCRMPLEFTAQNYATYKAWAVSKGRGAQWKDWTEDEPCPQRVNAADTLSDTHQPASTFCDVHTDIDWAP